MVKQNHVPPLQVPRVYVSRMHILYRRPVLTRAVIRLYDKH